ncbi:MAG: hypothetical protein HY099_03405 [Nitrospirae bacterium]|nr:hypothetical protein [Nitrospirota bacterium]
MPLLCPIDNLKDSHEMVICDSELSQQAHQQLFRFSDEVYVVANTKADVFDAISSAVSSCNSTPEAILSKIHIALCWENLLKVSLWKAARPAIGDVFTLLRKAGIGSEELQPYKTADINDMFPWLYYGKRFEILRRVCHSAKKQMEGRLKNHSIRVDCHLIAEDTERIVASSL